MKSKIKIQKLLMKGMAVFAAGMMVITPIASAATSLDDSGYLEGSWWNQLLYGTVGSTAKEIEEYFGSTKTTLYITNETQLRALAEYVNSGNDCSLKEIYLVNDIEVDSSVEWTPIGTRSNNKFNGTFDGNGHTIKGVTYVNNGKPKNELWMIGLFGYTGSSATIKNLATQDFNINMITSSDVSLEDMDEMFTVDSGDEAGNIVGHNEGTIINCVNKSDIIGGTVTGGIAGYNSGKIKYSTNVGMIKGVEKVGGIVGQSEGTSNEIINCLNTGNIFGAHDCVGGIAGSAINTKIKNTINSSLVRGRNRVGGIVGNGKNANIEKCGVFENTSTEDNNIDSYELLAKSSLGGVVGYDEGSTITNCVNYAEQRVIMNYAGGIVGRGTNTKINSVATVTAISYDSKNWTVEYNEANPNKIDKATYECLDNPIIKQLALKKEKEVGEHKIGYYIGGIVGCWKNCEINKALKAGSVSGRKYVGGIIGGTESGSADISTATNLKEITIAKCCSDNKHEAGSVTSVFNTKKINELVYYSGDWNAELVNESIISIDNVEVYTETDILNEISLKEDSCAINQKSDFRANKTYVDVSKFPTVVAAFNQDEVPEGENNKIIGFNKEAFAKLPNEKDKKAPTIKTEIYVENPLETNRYTAGKEILFKITTSEEIQGTYEDIELKVGFSKSGDGKYNYRGTTDGSGYAKCIESRINFDGTTTWIYSYILQELDEGNIRLDFTAGEIKDLAGNETSIADAFGIEGTKGSLPTENWVDDLNVEFELYKNSVTTANKLTNSTILGQRDKLIVVAKFDKLLYDIYGEANDGEACQKLTSSKAPSIYLNNKQYTATEYDVDPEIANVYGQIVSASVNNNTSTKKTTITYTFNNIGDSFKRVAGIESLTLKNDRNTSITVGEGVGRTGYSSYNYTTYDESKIYRVDGTYEPEDNYIKFLNPGALINYDVSDFGITINPPNGGIIGSVDLYADTIAPTVKITTDKTNPTNANSILYTFEFSEKVEGFTINEEDITVNNGTKGAFTVVEEGLKYTLVVEPNVISGHQETLQVIVEAGAVKDKVGKDNIRQEHNLTIDKVKPEFRSYNIKHEANKIIVDLMFSEEISDVSGLVPTLTVGGVASRGTWDEEAIINDNKVTFTYNVSAADGGEVEITVAGKVKDVVGNESDELNISIENNITLEQTVIKNGTIEYSFAKGNEAITDFTTPTLFKKDEVIKVTKVDGANVTTYSYTVVAPEALSLMNSMNLTQPAAGQTEGTVEFKTNNSGSIKNISEANIWFDAGAPRANVVVTAKNPVSNNTYSIGSELAIKVTTTEAIDVVTVAPEINVLFGGIEGKFNNGKAQYVGFTQNEFGIATIEYRYVVTVGDEGKVSVNYASGEIKDLAGNTTDLTTLNTEEGFIFDDVEADTMAPTVTITTVDITNPTNANSIVYTFEFSEEVTGFDANDITVNNGNKKEETFTPVEPGLKYTLEVEPSVISGKEGTVQVIVEAGAVQDKVGKDNIRQEHILSIDKVKPTIEDYEIRLERENSEDENSPLNIIVDLTFSENVSDVSGLVPTLIVGEEESKGTWAEAAINGNKATYIYTVSVADGGKVEVIFAGTVKDVAGNDSDELNVQIENDITLVQNSIVVESKGAKDIYTFAKGETPIADFTNPTYFVKGNIIKVTKVSYVEGAEEPVTTTYEYTIDGTLDLSKMISMNLRAPVAGQTVATVEFKDNESGSIDISKANIWFDTVAPILETEVFVEDALETQRYTKGQEIIFQATTSEVIREMDTAPEVRAVFSKSGIGKYNYKGTTEGAGYAKCIETKTNPDGTTTWKYSYIAQEFDEGNVRFEYTNANDKLTDIAGNETLITVLYGFEGIDEPITGIEWPNTDDLNVEFELYKNSVSNANKVTSKTIFGETDELIVVAKFDKLLYDIYGTANEGELCSLIRDVNAPMIYLNNKVYTIGANGEYYIAPEVLERYERNGNAIDTQAEVYNYVSDVTVNHNGNTKTTITYTFNNVGTSFKNVAKIENITLINNNNTSIKGEALGAGRTPYSDTYYREYIEEEITNGNVKFIEKDAVMNYDTADMNIIIDPLGAVGEGVIESDIYIDTEAPIVEITTSKNPTNADSVVFTFEFNELVEGFTAKDITVNNGNKKEETFTPVEPGLKYTLEVETNVTIGKEGTLQVIVEEGSVKDKVGINNIRQERVITIDKVKPTFESYTIREEAEKIIVELTFSEKISDASELKAILTAGGLGARGEWDEAVINENKVTFTYNVSAIDGGKVEVTLAGTVKDVAGNDSEELNISVENDITLVQNVIKVGTDIYSFAKGNEEITDFTVPTYFVKGDVLKVTKVSTVDGKTVETIYSYTLTTNMDLNFIEFVKLINPEKEGTEGTIVFEETDQSINISKANIWFDTIAPTVKTEVFVEEALESGRYTKGQEIIFQVTTSEPIRAIDIIPEIKVKFSESGTGKYNYRGTNEGAGYAKFIGTANYEGRTVLGYSYIAQEFDEGELEFNYTAGVITDLAGNTTDIEEIYTPETATTTVSGAIWATDLGVTYKFYKNEVSEDAQVTSQEYFTNGEDLIVVAEYDKVLYEKFGSLNQSKYCNLLTEDKAPTLLLNGNLAGEVDEVSLDEEGTKTIITYVFENISDEDIAKLTQIRSIVSKNDRNGDALSYSSKKYETYEEYEADENKAEFKALNADAVKVTTENIPDIMIDPINVSGKISEYDIYVDTTAPRATISTGDITNPTNASSIVYTFEFSEEVTGFMAEDIIVSNGNKGTLETVEDGLKYTLVVEPTITSGNEGEMVVAIVENAVQDLIGKVNAYTSNTIKVDRIAPIFISLESYGIAHSKVTLSKDIDTVQEYYKSGDTIKIVATFSENIDATTTVPELALQFSESGNAKVDATNRYVITKDANKITYEYTITDGDKGTLSVRGFVGTVVDAAGNATEVAKKALDGNTIIADTIAPVLKELNVVTAEGTYNAEKTIEIHAVYDENVYVLVNNEIKNITVAEDTTPEEEKVAPILKVKFGSGEEREAIFAGYVDGDKTKLKYEVVIQGANDETGAIGDKGDLRITSYTNKENAKVCDIAGNEAVLTGEQTGNTVTADTEKPEVEGITAQGNSDVDGNVYDGIGFYKEGSEINVTVKSKETIATDVITVKYAFKETEPTQEEYKEYKEDIEEHKEDIEEHKEDIEGDLNLDNSNLYNFTVNVEDGENGYLWVKVEENNYYDVAGNGNVASAVTKVENIYADTTDPYLATNQGPNSQWNVEYIKNDAGIATGIRATGIFNEKVYSMQNNTLKELSDIPTFGVIINGSIVKSVEANVSNPKVEIIPNNEEISLDDQTKLTYEIDITDIDTTEVPSGNFIDGTVYDRAGNIMTIELPPEGDTASPIFKDIKVITPNDFYKAGETIEIVARFIERTQLVEIPRLTVNLGDRKNIILTGEYNPEDVENTATIKVVRYTFDIGETDNGELNIVSLIGKVSDGARDKDVSKIYIDLPETQENDINTKSTELLRSDGILPYANNDREYDNVFADTTRPYITDVEVRVNGKAEPIAAYNRENATMTVARTNVNEVEYIVKFSELIENIDESKIQLYNGEKVSIVKNNENSHGHYDQITIKVNTTIEGVQSLMILGDAISDRAGNTNQFERYNMLTVDFTKPTVRFISEYNGGVYVLPTNIDKVEIRPNVEINEDITTIEYKWDNEENYTSINNYSASSDIAIPAKTFTEVGTHVLHIRVVDLAGNVTETSKTYIVSNSAINIILSTESQTNQDIIATVYFDSNSQDKSLTDNRKVMFKAEGSDELVTKNAIGVSEDGGINYEITTNGTIYAEATDRVGNKVFVERTVSNIDTVDPEISIELNGANLVVGADRKATIKTEVETYDNRGIEEAKYIFLQEDIDVSGYKYKTEEQKAAIRSKITNDIADRIQDLEKVIESPEEITAEEEIEHKPYYLYVLVKDTAGNEIVVKSEPFTIYETNIRYLVEDLGELGTTRDEIEPDIKVEDLIKFVQTEENIKDTAHVMIYHDNQGIITESSVTLEDENYGKVDDYNYEYIMVELYGNTIINVEASDACGNKVYREYEVTDIKGPEFYIYGNPENWTNEDVELEIYSYKPLESLTMYKGEVSDENKENISLEENNLAYKAITEYGNYIFVAKDIYGNTSDPITVEVKIDKSKPEIIDVQVLEDGNIEITANDIDKTLNKELSGIKEYAITLTSEVPVEWSTSNIISTTVDGKFYVWARDNAGNIEMKPQVYVKDTIKPELTITTDVPLNKWTNTNINATVEANEELRSLVVRYTETVVGEDGSSTEEVREISIKDTKTYEITSNGTYEIIAVDLVGNETKETLDITKIDKDAPVISNATPNGKEITITATDAEGASGVKEYAITATTEVPVKWSTSNKIKVTEDGVFYAWTKDNAGNVKMREEVVVVDTTAPTITFNYLSQTVTVGMPLETNIDTNEEAIISCSWDKETWVDSQELLTSLKVSEKSTTVGTYTLYVKATDNAGNTSKVQTLSFEVVTMEEIKQPDIVFEDIPTIQVNGVRYVKVSPDTAIEYLTNRMNLEALCGKTPEYTKLTEDGKLRTGSEICINGSTKYIVVVKGDINGDGQIDFVKDIIRGNNYRLGIIGLSIPQILAADVNDDGKIEFVKDLIAINNYRLGLIKSL